MIQANSLFHALMALKTVQEAEAFLQDLCTPTELQAMADRWRVLLLLKEGKPYREIYELTGVSLATIVRVARTLQFGEGGYDRVFKRLNTQPARVKKEKTNDGHQ